MRRAIPVLLMLWCAACDDDPPPPPRVDAHVERVDAGPRADAGMDDAGGPGDAGGMDGAVVLPDDGGAVPPLSCARLDDPPLILGVDMAGRDRTVAAVATTTGFGLLWIDRPEVTDRVRFLALPSSGAAGAATTVAEVARAEARVALARTSSGWLTAWTDNEHGNYEVSLQPLSSAGAVMGNRVRLTDDPVRDDQVALLATDDGALATWVRDGVQGRARALGSDGSARAGEVALDVGVPLVLADQPSPSAYWVEAGRAYHQEIDASGLSGALHRLDTEGNVAGSMGAARSGSLAAAVFAVTVGVRSEVRFRPLDEDGAPRAPERIVTPPPGRGTGPAVASLAGGNVVAFRAPDGDVATIRVRLVETSGAVVGEADVATTTAAGGAVALAVAGDGRILVAWREEGDAPGFRAARMECSDGP